MTMVSPSIDLAEYQKQKTRRWNYFRNEVAQDNYYAALSILFKENHSVNFTPQEIEGYISEYKASQDLKEAADSYHEKAEFNHILKSFDEKLSLEVAYGSVLYLYVMTRILKPEVIVETGCATGWSSAQILQAIELNQKGKLYSIDLPPQNGRYNMNWDMPNGYTSGFLIPEKFKKNWTLIQGDCKEELVKLFLEIGKVDVFYHDSDHTYNHMMWEYTSAWPYIKDGGVLVSDDIGFNASFWDFAIEHDRDISILDKNKNYGAISKPLKGQR